MLQLEDYQNLPVTVQILRIPSPPHVPSMGFLKRQDIRIEVIFEENDIGEAPPPPPLMTPRQYPDEIFEIVKI